MTLGLSQPAAARDLEELNELGCGQFAFYELERVAKSWTGEAVSWSDPAGMARTLDSIEEAVADHGAAVCPVLSLLGKAGSEDATEDGLLGLIWAAQATLLLSECSDAMPTDRITAEMEEGWRRARQRADLPDLAEHLSIENSIALFAAAMAEPLCGTGTHRLTPEVIRLLPYLGGGICVQTDLADQLVPPFSRLEAPLQQRAMLVIWSRWCGGAVDEQLRELVIGLARDGAADPFWNAPPEARLLFGAVMMSDPALADLRERGLDLVVSSGGPSARAFLQSAIAAGLVADVPAAALVPPMAGAGAGGPDAPGLYALFRQGQLPAVEAAAGLAASLNDNMAALEAESIAYGGPFYSASLDTLIGLARLAEAVATEPEAAARAMAMARPDVLLALGDVLLEGHSERGRNVALGVTMLRAAAETGLAAAEYRLAIALLNGLGAPPEREAAIEQLERAADGGELGAIFALAAIKESGPPHPAAIRQAGELYRLLLDIRYPDDVLPLLRSRIMAGSPFFNSEKGRSLLMEFVDREGGEYSIEDIARTYLCVECGTIVNMSEGLWWLRQGAGRNMAPYDLAAILIRNPELQLGPDELQDLFGTMDEKLVELLAPIGAEDDGSIARLEAAFTAVCTGSDVPYYCTTFAHDLAVGRFSARYAALGLKQLKRLFLIDRYEPASPNTHVVWALVDAYAFYGEAAEALRVSQTIAQLYWNDEDAFRARDQTLRRLVGQLRQEPDAERAAPVEALLRRLASAGDLQAESLRALLLHPLAAAMPVVPDLATAQDNYDRQAAKAGISRGLASGARLLADALSAQSQNDEALRYELIALQTDRRLNGVIAATTGPLPAALADSCTLSRASGRLEGFGYPGLAIAVAKLAVNRLQEVRRDIVAVQHDLQVCFASVVSDSYRALADLLIRNKRLDEGQQVLAALQEFETFAYFGHDPQLVGAGLDAFPLTPGETALLDLVGTIDPPMTERVLRRRALQQKEGLSAAEAAELASLDAIIAEEGARTAGIAQMIAGASEEVPQDLHAQLMATKGRLRSEFDGQAVVVYYAVLPDRMHAILVTPNALRAHTWPNLGGLPFDEKVLNARIAAFRGELQHKRSNPNEAAAWFFDLLLAPFWQEIVGSGATELFVSPDRQLRLLPFSALRTNDRFLVEQYDIATVSRGGEPNAPGASPHATMAALGVGAPPPGYDPLPGVGLELDGLVADDSGYGLFAGEVHEDDDFTLSTLRRAVARQSEEPHALLHIASHFILGASEADSFLLLGGQGSLSLEVLRQEIIAQNLDFGSIGLVTLSACQTAVSPDKSGGEQLASLAGLIQNYARRSVMATLWSVSDRSTALFTQRFYEIWQANPDRRPAWALSRTMREFITANIGGADPGSSIVGVTALKSGVYLGSDENPQPSQFAHPFYWAPFILFQGG